MTDLAPGTPAPAFDMPIAGGGRASLADLMGQAVVLYFYPKADTPGCTTEGQDFTALLPQFQAAGAEIIGVSRDTVAKLERFKTRQGLGVTLASDETGTVTEAYGVWGEKSLYGRVYMGIERATFLINSNGLIGQVWRKVKVTGHVAAVLKAARGG